nr:zinc-dependent peptidase [Propionivibrio sp.]
MAIGKLIGWLRGKQEPEPLPDDLWQATLESLPFLARLNDEEQARLRALAEAFLTEKEFTSAGGLELTDAMCVSIAAQGCLPILNLGLDYYRDWVGVIVYPNEFVIPRS